MGKALSWRQKAALDRNSFVAVPRLVSKAHMAAARRRGDAISAGRVCRAWRWRGAG